MLDCLARLVNKKSRLKRMKFAQTGDREVRKPSTNRLCLFPVEQVLYSQPSRSKVNFGCAIETNNQTRKL